jgi:hypothetical protein
MILTADLFQVQVSIEKLTDAPEVSASELLNKLGYYTFLIPIQQC